MLGGGAPDDEVAAIYEKGVASRASRLTVANSVHWLAGYYLSHGQEESALRLAAEVSAVYSARGLETAAFVMEKLGRLPEAEGFLNASAKRYPGRASTLSLSAFANRHPEISPTHAKIWKATMAKAFPDGVATATLAEFEKTGKPPIDCIRLRRYYSLGTRKGLENGAIVVAVDGHRIRNVEQFALVRISSNEVLMKLIVYDGRTWQEVSARRWDRAIEPESIPKQSK
jgi:hypothetical protein